MPDIYIDTPGANVGGTDHDPRAQVFFLNVYFWHFPLFFVFIFNGGATDHD
jgi:hypothetical protein